MGGVFHENAMRSTANMYVKVIYFKCPSDIMKNGFTFLLIILKPILPVKSNYKMAVSCFSFPMHCGYK